MIATITIEFDTDAGTTTFSCKGQMVRSEEELAVSGIQALTVVMDAFVKVAAGEHHRTLN